MGPDHYFLQSAIAYSISAHKKVSSKVLKVDLFLTPTGLCMQTSLLSHMIVIAPGALQTGMEFKEVLEETVGPYGLIQIFKVCKFCCLHR